MFDTTGPASSEVPAVIAGRYRVLRELGRGGMGAVYLVEHTNTGEHLALKVLLTHVGLDPAMVERFKREARAPAQIRSEHVVRVTDADVAVELGGAPFLVMEALEGADLDKTVEQRGALPPQEVIWILGQVAVALDRAHAIGIVHRDLKPENLFLHRRHDGSSVVKILDFGISKAMGSNDIRAAGLTKSGAMMGTPLYMAPEQARGLTSAMGPGTDIWAIGQIAYNLLAGTAYWTAENITDLLIKIVHGPMARPSELHPSLGPAFDAWFARSCDREPANRWSNVTEQVNALAQALGVDTGAPAGTTMPRGGPPLAAAVAHTNPALGGATANAMSHTAVRLSPPPTSGRGKVLVPIAVVALVAVVGGVFALRGVQSGPEEAVPASSELPAATPVVLPTATATSPTAAVPPAEPAPSSSAGVAAIASASATPAIPVAPVPRVVRPATPKPEPVATAAPKQPHSPVAP